MTTREIILGITDWLNNEVCPKIQLKVPDDLDNTLKPRMASPTAFPLFVPSAQELPPQVVAPVPSMCVQLMKGNDNLNDGTRILDIRVSFSTWSPGIHTGLEYILKIENEGYVGGYTQEDENTYERSMDGWIDLYNMQDLLLQSVEGTGIIAGCKLDRSKEIEYGPFTQNGEIQNFYPYWHGWLRFFVKSGLVKKIPDDYEGLL